MLEYGVMAFRKIVKTSAWLWLTVFLTAAFGAANPNNPLSLSYNIGIIQTIEHPALDKTRQGIIDELDQEGFKKNLQWKWESAQMNQTLGAQIAQKFVGQQVDLIVAIGTLAAQAALGATRDSSIPIIFASVTDPKSAKLMRGNIAGVSNFVPVINHFELISQILPHKKRLGIIYNPGDANSVTLVEQMQKLASQKGLELEIATITKTNEVSAATNDLVGKKIDAIFINNDNTALAAFDAIARICNTHKIPLFASDVDVLEKGALAVRGPDQYELGRQAGRMVAKILRKEAKAEDLGTEYPTKVGIYLNDEQAKVLQISFPDCLKNHQNKGEQK